jgi:hypothetical protein
MVPNSFSDYRTSELGGFSPLHLNLHLGGGITPVDEIGLGPAHVLDYLSRLPIIPVEGNVGACPLKPTTPLLFGIITPRS